MLDRRRRENLSRTRTRVTWARARFGAAARVALPLLQLVAVVLALQISSFAHFASDVLNHLDCSADCDHEHSTDEGDREGPPGCPTCHTYAHAQMLYVQREP